MFAQILFTSLFLSNFLSRFLLCLLPFLFHFPSISTFSSFYIYDIYAIYVCCLFHFYLIILSLFLYTFSILLLSSYFFLFLSLTPLHDILFSYAHTFHPHLIKLSPSHQLLFPFVSHLSISPSFTLSNFSANPVLCKLLDINAHMLSSVTNFLMTSFR